MEKQKKWQLYLIIAVILLTVYNILPTVFYYAKPLKSPIDQTRAQTISKQILERINQLEPETEQWLVSFCKLIQVKPLTVSIDPQQPQFAALSFKDEKDASKFREFLPRAGALMPFVPAQLSLYNSHDEASKNVIVQRRIPIHFDSNQVSNYTQFSQKFDAERKPTPLYRALVEDRALQVGISFGGTSENAAMLQALATAQESAGAQQLLLQLSQNIDTFVRVYGEKSPITQRYFASFTQIADANRSQLVQGFLNQLDGARSAISSARKALKDQSDALRTQGQFLETVKQQELDLLTSREKTLEQAYAIVKRNAQTFGSGKTPFTYGTLSATLQNKPADGIQSISLMGCNPFVEQIAIDWSNEKILLSLYSDVEKMRQQLDMSSSKAYLRDMADQLLYNEIAFASRQSGETISPFQDKFEIALSQLQNSDSFIAMRLSTIAAAQSKQLVETLQSAWHPKHPDLSRDAFPIYDYETYLQLPESKQNLCLVVYSPSLSKQIPPQGFRMNSIYVIAKGMEQILDRLKNEPQSAQSAQFSQDFKELRSLLQNNGFAGFSGTSYGIGSQFANDFIFEEEDYFSDVLKASRENFTVHGTKRYAVLEFTDVEQRLLTENKIGNRIHEDLLKWRDDYHAAQLGIRGVSKYDVPKPTKNVYWSNFKLSFVKFFRGDDRKILHWGLDLSGGKTVQIELRDSNNRPVTNPDDIKQGINELYNRVNKMGVSEVTIRQEGNHITLDFPGSQGLSAAELVKASSMFFHIVNEKFSTNNALLSDTVNRFLQEVWNEALVTNRKDIEEINRIAWKHLHGDSLDPDVFEPRSEAARILNENGLRLANPQEGIHTANFNETYSKISMLKGDDFTDWYGQTHPLMFIFNNYALEGANLENIHSSYDPSRGNSLGFSIRGSYTNKGGQKINPQEDLFAWTSQFSKEKITGTPLEVLSGGRGWRMAVILNGLIISAPTLDSSLKDSASITGSFTQREINQLEADLKAGSLSYTPHILSEKNVSPELGSKERFYGILATAIAIVLVVGAMIGYYRFGGVVASVAVLLNLLVMWATLQNLEATMTLAGIAAIILTLGMAVDANVLVFERIREEFAISGRIASAVHAGYRKAFSAIVDSNVTTIIAAVVLLQFDSGPIKAFAVTMIIGIVSSMFTALFMTRFFFTGWVQNPKNKSLDMRNWFKPKNINFLKYTKSTIALTSVVVVLGCAAMFAQKNTIFGMDFSGGYALNVELQASDSTHYRNVVENALHAKGATSQEIQVRELTPSNHLRIFLGNSMQQSGHPFFGMPVENDLKEPEYRFETNPRIVWVVEALNAQGVTLTKASLENLDKSWTEVSGQMSSAMRNNAVIGLAIALLCILMYITIRFEFKYAISATICLAHDVVFTVAVLALLHSIGVPVQIDLNTIAALMTIVGYSLNDIIIVFDRIREDARLMRKSRFSDVINHAVNVTLSRTLMTSGTTLLVLIPLILLGGSTLFGFSLVMAIGVVFGTLSSLFIAAPLMKYFHDKELQKEERMVLTQR